MAWLNAENIKARFNFSLKDDTNDAAIDFASENAEHDLEEWLSDTDFTAAVGDTPPTDAKPLKRYKRTVNAHAFLTVYYVFLTNTQIRSGGSVKSEQDGDVRIVNYYSPKELLEMRAQYLDQAKNLIASFAMVSFTEQLESINGEYCSMTPTMIDECLN